MNLRFPFFDLFPLLALCLLFAGCRMVGKPAPRKPQFVRVQKVDGRWWFVRGDERFVTLGVNVVQPKDDSKVKSGGVYDVLPKYNNDMAAWAKDANARLRSWNFNTVAAWSSPFLYTNTTMYHTRVVWLGPWGRRDSRLIDVFAPAYSNAIDQTAREEIAPHAEDELLIGYFLNNELPWYGEAGWPTSPEVSVLTRYIQLPELAPGKIRAIAYLRELYADDFAAFARNWDTTAVSFEELARHRRMTPRKREAKKDTIAWAGIVADEYFKLCRDAMRRYDPNHLFLGVRFADRAQLPVMEACGRYADVVSVNHYRKTGIFDTEHIGAIAALADKPVMITEYSFRAMENSSGCGNTMGADVTVPTQQDRADRFRKYITAALAQPYIVGCDWHMYHDQPPAGRFDGEDSNYGLVDIHDNLYTTLLEAITDVNGRANEIHLQATAPLHRQDPRERLADYREVVIAGAENPLSEPVLFADPTCRFDTWGDAPRGGSIDAGAVAADSLRLSIHPGRGWGCGITFKPVPALSANPDGSGSVRGARRVLVRLRAPVGVKFSVGIQESGHGPLDAQTYGGYAGADGESYVHPDKVIQTGQEEYAFQLDQMEPANSYGNQRGNSTLDSGGIAQCHVFFPGGQKDFDVEFLSIKFD